MTDSSSVATVGVLALQGGFHEHLALLRKAAARLPAASAGSSFAFVEVRTPQHLARCDALIIPGGESTTISLVATQSGLMEPLKDFVKVHRKPTWGTCAGLILVADEANATKKGGQDLIGGLAVRVHRNHFGRQVDSFVADLHLPFLGEEPADATAAAAAAKPYQGVFIRAPVVEEVLCPDEVEILARVKRRRPRTGGEREEADEEDDVVAVRQGNLVGMSFHPELTEDDRIHAWWLGQVLKGLGQKS